MKKLLLLIFATLIPFSSYATYLVCDGGTEKFYGGGGPFKVQPGDDFELELAYGQRVYIENIPWCRDKPIYAAVTTNEIYMSCSHATTTSGKDTVFSGKLEISRRTGSYSYDWKMRWDGKLLTWTMQTGKCKVSEKTLF
jgi:hypothetical protein